MRSLLDLPVVVVVVQTQNVRNIVTGRGKVPLLVLLPVEQGEVGQLLLHSPQQVFFLIVWTQGSFN